MLFLTIYRGLVARLVATFIIALVVSPYSEPFAAIRGNAFGAANPIDVVSANADIAPVPAIVAVAVCDASSAADQSLLSLWILDSRRRQHAILRL